MKSMASKGKEKRDRVMDTEQLRALTEILHPPNTHTHTHTHTEGERDTHTHANTT